MLQKINFSEDDELYVLGDVVDRGPEPIKVIQDMMNRPNVELILGNHDYLMLLVMSRLIREVTEENLENGTIDENLLMDYYSWMADGGAVTIQQFHSLNDKDAMVEILDYIHQALVYEELEVRDKKFVLTHAGVNNHLEGELLLEHHFTDFIFNRQDYSKPCFEGENTYLITGHTPTCLIREDKQHLVYEGNNHIAIDCGCVFGGRLAAYCLDTGEITYVDAAK